MKIQSLRITVMCVISLLCTSCETRELDKGERGSVRAAYFTWVQAVEKAQENPKSVVALYSDDAILLPTFSSKRYSSKEEIRKYFTQFLSLQDLSAETKELITKEYGNIAMNTGFYNFTYIKNGKKQIVQARFDFWYRKVKGKWEIIFQQSSVLSKDQ